jgi:hypothetical protein
LTVGTQNTVESPDIELIGVGDAVRIPEETLNSVGYICELTSRDGDNVFGDPYATGFFVSVPCEALAGNEMYYFVTAKHVAHDLKDRETYFSVNRKGGGTTHQVPRLEAAWYLHPTDQNADVAVIQVALSAVLHDLSLVPIASFGMPQRLKELNIGIGDEVHSIGLFSPFPGQDKNVPIVRFGNISMMPAETMQTELGHTEMYLIEARSIGGMSGSPVFVRPTLSLSVPRRAGAGVMAGFIPGTGETLLGMAHGHWDIREEDINKPSFTHDSKRGVNYGVALVVPAFKIYETIYQPGLVAMRRNMEMDFMKKQKRTVPTTDSRKAKKEISFTQGDFEAALTKTSRKLSEKK